MKNPNRRIQRQNAINRRSHNTTRGDHAQRSQTAETKAKQRNTDDTDARNLTR